MDGCTGRCHLASRSCSSISRLTSSLTSATLANPGNGILIDPRCTIWRFIWSTMSSCSFGTSASLARLPKREVVLRFRVKPFGGMLICSVGSLAAAEGGVNTTCESVVNELTYDKKRTVYLQVIGRAQERSSMTPEAFRTKEMGNSEVLQLRALLISYRCMSCEALRLQT